MSKVKAAADAATTETDKMTPKTLADKPLRRATPPAPENVLGINLCDPDAVLSRNDRLARDRALEKLDQGRRDDEARAASVRVS